MKKKKIVHRIPKEAYLVSKRNRVFIDKKKEDSANACREKISNLEDMANVKWCVFCNCAHRVDIKCKPQENFDNFFERNKDEINKAFEILKKRDKK